MGKRIEAYVDTSALIAFVDRSDTHHPLFRRLFSEPPGIITTTLVVAEGHAWFLRRAVAAVSVGSVSRNGQRCAEHTLCSLLRLDARVLDHLRPPRDIGFDGRRELIGRVADRLKTQIGEFGAQVG